MDWKMLSFYQLQQTYQTKILAFNITKKYSLNIFFFLFLSNRALGNDELFRGAWIPYTN
jgi:hypothetical protein